VQAFFSTVPESQWRVMVSIPPGRDAARAAARRRLPGRDHGRCCWCWRCCWRAASAGAPSWPIEYLGRSAEDLGQGREVAYAPQQIVEIDAVARRMAEASRQIRASRPSWSSAWRKRWPSERAQAAMMRGQKLEALGRLTGGIAHEFNNLLQTLTTALQLAALTSTQPKVQSLIDTCKRTIGRATALTGQLGSFGRMQDAKLLTVDPANSCAIPCS
jgi:signal transduction histidine kinase